MVERLTESYDLPAGVLVASTVDSWQGQTNRITVAIHPLSGADQLDDFNSAFGRLAVTLHARDARPAAGRACRPRRAAGRRAGTAGHPVRRTREPGSAPADPPADPWRVRPRSDHNGDVECVARDLEALPQGLGTWTALNTLQSQVVRQIEQLSPYSDEKSATLEALRRKLRAVERAIHYLLEKKLIPDMGPEALT